MSCDIIIPVFNQKKYTEGCIESIKKNTASSYRIIIIDDKSNDPEMLVYLNSFKDDNIIIIRNEKNLGWVGSVNHGIKESSAEYVCIMNNDTIVSDGWLEEMIGIAQKADDIGLVNPVWEKPDRVLIKNYARSLKKYSGEFIETDWARGFCFLVKRKVVDRIGGLDEAYSPGYYDDCDFSVRAIRAGFRPVLAKASYVYHYRNGTHESALKKEGMNSLLTKHKKLFYERWGRPLRLVFIFTREIADNKAVENMFYSLARKQHHLYVWASSKNVPQIEHTNVKIIFFPRVFFGLFATLGLLNNLGRNISKKYNGIFLSDAGIFHLFLSLRLNKKTNIFLDDFNSLDIEADIMKQMETIKNGHEINSCHLD